MGAEFPHWYGLVLLALAAFRTWKLIADDAILDGPRKRLLRLPPRGPYREKWDLFLTCPWCAGFWITLGWWVAWLLWEDWVYWAATPWALSALVGLQATVLAKLTDDS